MLVFGVRLEVIVVVVDYSVLVVVLGVVVEVV